MTDWNRILKSHVIESICSFSYKWWGMGIRFYDKHNNCISGSIHFKNPFCKLIHSFSEGQKNCRQCCITQLKELDKDNKPFYTKCYAGLNMTVTPITVDEEYVGAMISSGLKFSEKKSPDKDMYVTKLRSLGFDGTIFERGYNSLISLNGSTEEFINDFLKLAVTDVKINYKSQKDKEQFAKKSKNLRENSYHEKYKNIIFTSSAMNKVFDTVEILESSEKTVLIEGETGTGKGLLATAIHYNSLRKDKVFIIQNCSAFNDALLNSELYGHVKGSFTGAKSDKKGLFQIADGGTLFLDEIGDMSIESQSNLLRVLENGTFYKLGGNELKSVDVRIIAATNKDLHKQIENGLFRKDLFYRINAISITMPPLRERKGDIIPLLYHFIETYAMASNSTLIKEVDQEVLELFEAYDWPGNVRELKNQVERLIILSGLNNKLKAKLLPPQINGNSITAKHEKRNSNRTTLKDILRTVERSVTEDELKKSNWNKTLASRMLGISRASLNNKIENFNLSSE